MSGKLTTSIVNAKTIITGRLNIHLIIDTNDKTGLLDLYKENLKIKDYINFYEGPFNLDQITELIDDIFAENCNYWFNCYNKLNNRKFGNLLYVIKLTKGEIIGNIDLDIENKMVSIFIDHSYSRQGYGSEALSAAVNFLKNYSDYTNISVECNDEKSRLLARKCGFTSANSDEIYFYIAKPSEPFSIKKFIIECLYFLFILLLIWLCVVQIDLKLKCGMRRHSLFRCY